MYEMPISIKVYTNQSEYCSALNKIDGSENSAQIRLDYIISCPNATHWKLTNILIFPHIPETVPIQCVTYIAAPICLVITT